RLLQIDKIDPDMACSIFETFRQNPRQTQRDFRVLGQQYPEIRAVESEYNGWLNGTDGGGSRPPGEQRHLSDRSSFAQLCHQEIDASIRVFLSDLHQPGLDDVHRHTGSTLADNHFGGKELDDFQAFAQFGEAIRTQFGKKFDVFQELYQLIRVRRY